MPLLETRLLHPEIRLEEIDGIVLTSKQAVRALQAIAPEWSRLPALCVGRSTAAAAAAAGAEVLQIADGYGDDLYDLIRKHSAAFRWLYARPKSVASDFAQRLRDEGVNLRECIVYETVCAPKPTTPPLPPDAVLIFTSPSGYECFSRRFSLRPEQAVVAIGRTTRKAIPREHTVFVAEQPSVAACIALAKML